jgi:hypothetical protein
MTVVETGEFLKRAKPLMEESERAELVAFVGANPEAGEVIPESGGVRKIRWALQGRASGAACESSTTTTTSACPSFCYPHTRRTERRTSAKPSGTP